MTILRWISDIGVGVIFGILLTGSVVYLVLEELSSISIFGLGVGTPDYPWITKVSLVIGVVHGLLVALGVILSFRTNAVIGNIFAGLIATEIGIALGQFYIFSYLWKVPSTGVVDKIGNNAGYFLIFSAILLVPTVLLATIVSIVDRVFTRV